MALNLQLPDAGRMQHLVTIYDKVGTVDSRGHRTKEYKARDPISAWVQPLRGDELLRAQSIYAQATHRVHVYADDTITPENRLSYGGRVFEIGYVENVNEAGGRMWLVCKEESK